MYERTALVAACLALCVCAWGKDGRTYYTPERMAWVAENLEKYEWARKERDAIAMSEAMSAETHDAVMAAVRGTARQSNPYNPAQRIQLPPFIKRAA